MALLPRRRSWPRTRGGTSSRGRRRSAGPPAPCTLGPVGGGKSSSTGGRSSATRSWSAGTSARHARSRRPRAGARTAARPALRRTAKGCSAARRTWASVAGPPSAPTAAATRAAPPRGPPRRPRARPPPRRRPAAAAPRPPGPRGTPGRRAPRPRRRRPRAACRREHAAAQAQPSACPTPRRARRRRRRGPGRRRVGARRSGPGDGGREALLRELALVDLLLDRPRREEAVGVAGPRVAVAPAPRGRLLVHGRVPGPARARASARRRRPPTPPRDESKRTRRLPPIRFRPQPPAVDDSRKQKWSRPAWTSPFTPSSRRGRGDDVAPKLMSTRVPAAPVVEAVRELLALLGRPRPSSRHQGQPSRTHSRATRARDCVCDATTTHRSSVVVGLPPARGGVPRDHRA